MVAVAGGGTNVKQETSTTCVRKKHQTHIGIQGTYSGEGLLEGSSGGGVEGESLKHIKGSL